MAAFFRLMALVYLCMGHFPGSETARHQYKLECVLMAAVMAVIAVSYAAERKS